MRRTTPFILTLFVAAAQSLFGAGTNVVPADIIAKIEARELEFRARGIFETVTNAAWNLGKSNLLCVTVIDDSRCRSWYPYVVKESGEEHDVRMTFYAAQNTHRSQLTAEQLRNLRAALAELPCQNATPPLERTVLVGYKSGTNWLNRIYDFKQQPRALRRIHEIIGEREEFREPR